jgi:hypothetical protein
MIERGELPVRRVDHPVPNQSLERTLHTPATNHQKRLMSGRKQHHIPQLLLRGFGRQKGNATQVVVYSIYRGIFATATDKIAAKRYFYSKPSEIPEVQTLDERITSHESKLADAILEFRAVPAHHAVDSRIAAETVTHLCIRQEHVRESIGTVIGKVVDFSKDVFSEKDRARKALGIDAQTPSNLFRDEANKLYDKLYEQYCDVFRTRGITKSVFEQFAFDKAKADFDDFFTKYSPTVQETFGRLREEIGSKCREAHNETLEQSLAPKARVEHLERFSWSVVVQPPNSFVLPDCVAISRSTELGFLPLSYAGMKSDVVFMPLCHDRLLKGELKKQSDDRCDGLTEMCAACSHDFFIALDHTPEFEQLVPRIGERTRELGDYVLKSAAEKYGSTSSHGGNL